MAPRRARPVKATVRMRQYNLHSKVVSVWSAEGKSLAPGTRAKDTPTTVYVLISTEPGHGWTRSVSRADYIEAVFALRSPQS